MSDKKKQKKGERGKWSPKSFVSDSEWLVIPEGKKGGGGIDFDHALTTA